MKKTAKITLPKLLVTKIDEGQLIRECQSVIEANRIPSSTKLTFTCLPQHYPNALTEIISYVHRNHQTTEVIAKGNTDRVKAKKSDFRLCKVQVDKATWFEFMKNSSFRGTSKTFTAWTSNDKDFSIIFKCQTNKYDEALTEITKKLIAIGAEFVKPMKLRKYRYSLRERLGVQNMYAKSKAKVSQIADTFRMSPTSADAFCVNDVDRHPELFLTDSEVIDFNQILLPPKKKGKPLQ